MAHEQHTPSLAASRGRTARAAIRSGAHRGATAALAPDNVQANLVVVPSAIAADLRELCARNPVPCPLIEMLPPGEVTPRCAPGADLRTDLGAYRVWRDGVVVERIASLAAFWNNDLVAFLIGCSFTFERALCDANLTPRHVALGRNVPMYRTTVPLAPAGLLSGTWMVSMRPYAPACVDRVREVTRPFLHAHGEPFAWGDPAALGIRDIRDPDEGDAVPLEEGEVPVFWGCGVTPQRAIEAARLPFAISHEPGAMFVTDLEHGEIRG